MKVGLSFHNFTQMGSLFARCKEAGGRGGRSEKFAISGVGGGGGLRMYAGQAACPDSCNYHPVYTSSTSTTTNTCHSVTPNFLDTHNTAVAPIPHLHISYKLCSITQRH